MIDTGIVGRPLATHRAVLGTRRLLAFAAAIGDSSAPVFDDAAPGFIAHPALCVALEWPVLSDPECSALVPDPQDRLRAVHLVQDSVFHRALRAGEHILTAGRVAGVWRSRAGTCTACTLCSADAGGETVVTSQVVALYRGVPASGPDRPPATPDALPAVEGADGGDGETIATLVAEPGLAHRYSECSGIWNPIHTERRVALAAGLPGTVLHGTATWAMAASALVARFGGGDAARLRRLRGRFGALVLPGERLQLRATARTEGDACHVRFSVCNAAGGTAIADGYARLSGARTPA